MLFAPLKAKRTFKARGALVAHSISKGYLCGRVFRTILRLRKQVRKTGHQAVSGGTWAPLGPGGQEAALSVTWIFTAVALNLTNGFFVPLPNVHGLNKAVAKARLATNARLLIHLVMMCLFECLAVVTPPLPRL